MSDAALTDSQIDQQLELLHKSYSVLSGQHFLSRDEEPDFDRIRCELSTRRFLTDKQRGILREINSLEAAQLSRYNDRLRFAVDTRVESGVATTLTDGQLTVLLTDARDCAYYAHYGRTDSSEPDSEMLRQEDARKSDIDLSFVQMELSVTRQLTPNQRKILDSIQSEHARSLCAYCDRIDELVEERSPQRDPHASHSLEPNAMHDKGRDNSHVLSLDPSVRDLSQQENM